MAWEVAEEYIDFRQSKHVIVLRNTETGAEHHLHNLIGLACCPTCGQAMPVQGTPMADVEAWKAKELAKQNENFKKQRTYAGQHPRARRK